jgi:hypothetical protein
MSKVSRFRKAEGSSKEEMTKRTEESQKRQGGSGKWDDFLVPDFDGDKFVATEGDHLIDIVPYLAGTQDPKLDEGKRAYMVDVYVHQKVGVNEDSILCPSSNYRGKEYSCPICEYQAKMRQSKQFSDDDIKELKPKRRVLYNVICYDNTEQEAKGVQVWEASYHLTENEILAIARNRRGGGHVPFADPDEGKSISFFREGKGASTRYKGYQFVEREEPISDEDLDAAYCLDELLDVKNYEEINEIFLPTAPEIPGEEKASSKKEDAQEEEQEKEEYQNDRKPRRSAARKAKEEEENDPDDKIDESDPPFNKNGEEDKEQEKKPTRMSRRRRI